MILNFEFWIELPLVYCYNLEIKGEHRFVPLGLRGFEKDLKGFLRIWWLAHIRTGAAWDRLTARRIYVYDVDFPPIGVLNLNEILFNRGARGEGARDARIATQLGLPLGFSI